MRCLLTLFAVLITQSAFASLTIFDVRRPIALSDSEVTHKDFYINGGSESGLTNGMVVTILRKVPLYDSYQNRSAGDLMLKVAKIKIIHVQKGLAVARLHSEISRDGTPILEDNYLMVGDQLDLGSASSDKSADVAPAPAPIAEPAVAPTPEPAHEAPAGAAQPAQKVEPPPPQAANITVNAMELSSQAPSPQALQGVDAPVLQ